MEEGPRTVGESARLNRLPSQLFRYRVVKRFVDLALVVVATPIFLPVICIVGVLVVLSSPGPVFYSHRRLRRNGSFFSMWKFRTMCVNSAEVLDEYLAKSLARTRGSRQSAMFCDGTASMSFRRFGM